MSFLCAGRRSKTVEETDYEDDSNIGKVFSM